MPTSITPDSARPRSINRCPECDGVVARLASECRHCGSPLPAAAAPTHAESFAWAEDQVPTVALGSVAPPAAASKAGAALALGVISLFCNLFYVPGILAIVWGGRERRTDGKAKAGFICGIIGTAFSALLTVLIVAAMASAGSAIEDLDAASQPLTSTPEITAAPAVTVAAPVTTAAPAPVVAAAPVTTAAPAPVVQRPTPPRASTSNETVSQSNARRKAESYLSFTAFSRQGLIEQLEYEGFNNADATYGADAVKADWFEQAAKKAKSYMEMTAFSRQGLIEQLMYEKFTQPQAEHGANSVGL